MMKQQLLWPGLLLLLAPLLRSCQATFDRPGPCSSTVTQLAFSLPPGTDCGWRCRGLLYTHTPGPAAGGAPCRFVGPYPLLAFFSGFLASAADYFAYSSHLATWGFAVVQYDFHLLAAAGNSITHTDEAEVGFLPHILAQLEASAADPSSPLHGQLDFNTLGAAGHSRGGKIAALHYAGSAVPVKFVFLVDPVDGTPATASQPGYPSAVKALAGQHRQLGLAGAGRIGACNGAPYATGNWSDFWAVSGAGSWLEVLPDAGHLQFADISSLLDLLCCSGCKGLVSHKEGMDLAKVPMTAWFHHQLRRHNDTSTPGGRASSLGTMTDLSTGMSAEHRASGSVQAKSSSSSMGPVSPSAFSAAMVGGSFRTWVCSQEAAHKIAFRVKGQGDICTQAAAAL